MKTRIFIATLMACVLALHAAFGQGALTPPGAPAPTMKSLDQIEPRTPISSLPFTVTQSGSYYLTTNVTVASGHGIVITANNVQLDLNGFTISSTQTPFGDAYAVFLGAGKAVTNISIFNGFINSGVTNDGLGGYSGSGFGHGIDYTGPVPVNVRVVGVSVTGCGYYGIYLGINSTVIQSCTASTIGYYGLVAESVSDSTALNCGTYGISAITAHNSHGYGGSYGIYAYTAENCFGSSAGGTGINATTAHNCYGVGSGFSGAGINATTAVGCYGYDEGFGLVSSVIGVHAMIAQNCYGLTTVGTGLNAYIANSCIGAATGSGGVATIVTYKYNMP